MATRRITGCLVGSQSDRPVSEWLAQAHPEPQRAYNEWHSHGVALLPLGASFDAVRIPAARIYAAVGSDTPERIVERLTEWLDGPVICDAHGSGGSYYALVPADAAGHWDRTDAPCLGSGTYLGVPRIDRCRAPAMHWVIAPRFEGDLCQTAYVAALLTLACSAAREQEQ